MGLSFFLAELTYNNVWNGWEQEWESRWQAYNSYPAEAMGAWSKETEKGET